MEDLPEGYLVGFADGEGCFNISGNPLVRKLAFRFAIAQREDHAAILYRLQREFGGFVNSKLCYPKPQVLWTIAAQSDILKLISYFDQFSPFVKAKEYAVWREAALFYYKHSKGSAGPEGNPQWLIEAIMAYKAELSRLKEYNAELEDFEIDIEDRQISLSIDIPSDIDGVQDA